MTITAEPFADTDSPPPDDVPRIRAHGMGLPDAAARRLAAAGIELVSDAENADLALVSTRVYRDPGVHSAVRDLLARTPAVPVLALVHFGGEGLAVEFLRKGVVGIVAEGNEALVVDWLGDSSEHQRLLEVFGERLGRSGAGAANSHGSSHSRSPFEIRLHDLSQGGVPPRLALIRIPEWKDAVARLSGEAVALLIRRLNVQVDDLCRRAGADLFDIAPGEYALIARDLNAKDIDVLGRNLVAVIGSFSPNRTSSLRAAFGHVGPDVTSDVGTLIELARRAVDVATEGDNPVVNADDLTRAMASSTELDTVIEAMEMLEQNDPAGEHGTRVAALVWALGEELNLDAQEVVHLRFAARFHDLGKIGLDLEHLSGEDAFEDPVYRLHPARGAEALRAAGEQVMAAVRHHHERWDGTGFPDGLVADASPIEARLIALADAYDRLTHDGTGHEDALKVIEGAAGKQFDPDLARLAIRVFADRVS
ncbi:MAG: HD domain-containing phosphohydrolase [Acidimicrobiia bacterium]